MKPTGTRQEDPASKRVPRRSRTEPEREEAPPRAAPAPHPGEHSPRQVTAPPRPAQLRPAQRSAAHAPAGGRASGHVTAAQVSTASGSGFGVAAGSRFHSLQCAGDYGVLLGPCRHRTRGSWRPRPGFRLRLQNQEEAFRATESEGVPGRRPAGGRVSVGRRPLGKSGPQTCRSPCGSPGSGVQSPSRCHLFSCPAWFPAPHSGCPSGWLLVVDSCLPVRPLLLPQPALFLDSFLPGPAPGYRDWSRI